MRFFVLSVLYIFLSSLVWAETAPSPRFVRNDGQWESSVLYRAEIPGGFLFLKEQSLVYVFYHTGDVAHQHHSLEPTAAARQANSLPSDQIRAHGYEIHFEGSNSAVVIEASHKNEEVRNYFLGSDPSHWAAQVPSFAEIIYKNLYPGIDMRIFSQQGSLKYECIVQPKADPSRIQFRYAGMDKIALNNGFLITETSVNKVTELPPYSYQLTKTGIRQEVASSYKLKENTLSFLFPSGYTTASTLVIDPILVFSTYSGSFTNNWGYTATYDDSGHLYSGGIEFGNRFPVTTGAFQTSFSGQTDVAILKYTPTGNALVYATYIGGSEAEAPHSMIVDKDNQLIIFGTTSSTNFPVSATAFDRTFNGGFFAIASGVNYANGSDLFITKLNATASSLIGSTYLGGSANDGLNTNINLNQNLFNYGDEFRGEVNLDASGNIYIASLTLATNFPMVNASQNTLAGQEDAVLCRLTQDLSSLTWSTYLGGDRFDAARGIRISPMGNVYAVGGTTSTTLPASADALNRVSSGRDEGFVVKYVNSTLSRLSYLGTIEPDQGYQIDLDENENVYLMGLTLGSYPVTSGVFTTPNSSQFIHALDANLSRTLFSTVIGSGNHQLNISPTAFMRSKCGLIYLAGWGGSSSIRLGVTRTVTTGLPVSPDAIRKTTNGDDYYLAILSQDASQLLYGTFFGSQSGTNHVDGGTSRFSPDGTIYHAACACRDNSRFPTTPGVWSQINNGALVNGCNNAAFKFDLEGLKADFRVAIDSCSVPALITTQNLSQGGKSYEWVVDGKVRSTALTLNQLAVEGAGEHTITLRVYNLITCKQVDSLSRKIVWGTRRFAVSPDTSICLGNSRQLSASGGTTYAWTPAQGIINPRSPTVTVAPTETTTYTVEISNPDGCNRRLSTTVNISTFNPDFEVIMHPECDAPTKLRLVANGSTGRAEWVIINEDGVARTIEDTVTVGAGGNYEIVLKAFQGVCEKTIRKNVFVDDPRPPVNVITTNEPNTHFETFKRGWKVEMYDQWGRPVYSNDSYQNDWKGSSVKNGVYFYRLTSPAGLSCKGWLQVLK